MDANNLRVFLLCTHSVAGALPLGLIICSDEKTDTLIKAFEAYKILLPENAFFNKGNQTGPDLMLTDLSSHSELRDSLLNVWPSSLLLLCTFHLLQQVWRWLFDIKHQIEKVDRPVIMSNFKNIVYSETIEKFEVTFSQLLCDTIVRKYPNLIFYLKNIYEMKKCWALAFRSTLRTRGNNTNNYIEAQFLIMKDLILQRVRAYNINALFDSFTVELDQYYKNKLLSVASASFDSYNSPRYFGKLIKNKVGIGFVKPSAEQISTMLRDTQNADCNIFVVFSASGKKNYTVDMNIGICECHVGKNGAPCKHQFVLWSNGIANSLNFMPIFNIDQRKYLAEIALELNKSSSIVANSGEATTICEKDDALRKEALQALSSSFETLRSKITIGDKSLLLGIKKFNERGEKMSSSLLATNLHTFGVKQFSRKKNSVFASLKKFQKNKICVQPEAVKRRKANNGGEKGYTKRKLFISYALKNPIKKKKP
nr:uncharacterized protein LOC124812379 [Hydra vulgaris]